MANIYVILIFDEANWYPIIEEYVPPYVLSIEVHIDGNIFNNRGIFMVWTSEDSSPYTNLITDANFFQTNCEI